MRHRAAGLLGYSSMPACFRSLCQESSPCAHRRLADADPVQAIIVRVLQARDLVGRNCVAKAPDQIDPAIQDAAILGRDAQQPPVGIALAGLPRIAMQSNVAPQPVGCRFVAPGRLGGAQIDHGRIVRQIRVHDIRDKVRGCHHIAPRQTAHVEITIHRIMEAWIRAQRVAILVGFAHPGGQLFGLLAIQIGDLGAVRDEQVVVVGHDDRVGR
jgi:hypothetical protein